MNRADKFATKRAFGRSTLFFVTGELLTYLFPFQMLRLIRFSLAGFNSFLSRYKFI